ncbi:carboxylic ester hydrolase [Aureococcus anophagefferens]|nr:carboxylic ester hydrolase [Aureococcus anophagefferens]
MKKKKTIRIAHRPDNHESEHPETYWELFYDLILVVVFMRLSAVKYNPSATGYATTVALFLSFWSSWSLLNVYLTKFAADDVLHRFFLAFHVVSSYVAATFLSHVDYEFFDFNHQATYFATATIDTGLKLLGLGLSIVLFGCTFALNPHVDPKASKCYDNFHERRALSEDGADADEGCRDGVTVAPKKMRTVALWLVAVLVEQLPTIYTCVGGSMHFCSERAGERMSAWIMLAFGESIVGMLDHEHTFAHIYLKVDVLTCLAVVSMAVLYFDTTHVHKLMEFLGDQGARYTQAAVMLLHGPLSMTVFLMGVGLKGLGYTVSNYEDLMSGGYTLDEINNMHKDYMWLTVTCMIIIVAACSLSGYLLPVRASFPRWRLHLGRLGSIFVILWTLHLAANEQTLNSECLKAASGDEGARRRLEDHADHDADHDDHAHDDESGAPTRTRTRSPTTAPFMHSIIMLNILAFGAVFIGFVAVDHEREHTYDAFEEEGHGGAVHVHDASEHREGREMAELGGEEGASTGV